MELEAGKKYVDRRGRIYGPLVETGQFFGESTDVPIWYANGLLYGSQARECSIDLVAEHVEFVPGNHWVTPVNDFVFTVGGVGAGGPSFRMPDQDADFVGEFDGMIYSNDPLHVLRAGVDQVCVLGKWTPWSQCSSSMLEETAFTRVRYPKSAAPVEAHVIESPGDFVEITDASHELRRLIDFVWSVSDKEWTPVRGLEGSTVGYVREHLSNSYTKPSCRRRDLPVPQTAVYPGEQYRLIGKDELIERHDEYRTADVWLPCTDTVGRKFGETRLNAVRRRKPFFKHVEPGEGYRLLEPHEVTLPTDERTYSDNRLSGWNVLSECNSDMVGKRLSDVRAKHLSWDNIVIRRKIEPAIDSVEVELCVNKINPYAFCLLARQAGEFKHGEVALRFDGGKFYIDTPKADS